MESLKGSFRREKSRVKKGTGTGKGLLMTFLKFRTHSERKSYLTDSTLQFSKPKSFMLNKVNIFKY
nr:unnamed protein product [Callosobruchus chinensis]